MSEGESRGQKNKWNMGFMVIAAVEGAPAGTGLVDGVLSQQLRESHPEAFQWDHKSVDARMCVAMV